MVDGAHISQPEEVHMIQCSFERNVFNSKTDNSYLDYGVSYTQNVNGYGQDARFGQTFHAAQDVAGGDPTETNSLKFQANVLYEFGNKSYIIERDGKMAEDYPSVTRKENIVAGRSFAKDRRLSGYKNTDARDIIGAIDEFNVQG